MVSVRTNHTIRLLSIALILSTAPQHSHAQNDSNESFQIASVDTHAAEQRKRNNRLSALIGRGRSILDALAEDPATASLQSGELDGLSYSEQQAYEQKIREWMAEDTEPQDIILVIGRKSGSLSSSTIVGIQQGLDVFIPLKQLSDTLRFAIEIDLQNQTATGFAGSEQKTFTLDLNNSFAQIAGQNFAIPQDKIIVRDFGAGLGDFFIETDVMNDILDLQMDVEFASMTLNLNSPRLLPAELEEQRKKRYEKLARRNEVEDIRDDESTKYFENKYQMFGKPSVVLNNQLELSNENNADTVRNVFNARGASELLGTSADYSARILSDSEDRFDIGNVRLRMQRRADAGHELPLGLKTVEGGDISSSLPNLVRRTASGAGVKFTNKKLNRAQSFDTITVEGTGQPGWDVELYNGTQLVDYGTVDNRGEYRFEDIQLSYGNNTIKTVLYGPQGQMEEIIDDYNIANTLLPSGEVEYSASLMDANADFIPVFNEDSTTRSTDGLLYTGTAKVGLTESISPFVTVTSTNSQEDRKKYVSAGADFSALGGIGRLEGYKELGAGTALDARYATNFAGIRLNARGSMYNNFESEEAQFGDRRKTREYELRGSKSFQTELGNFSVGADARHVDYLDDSSRRFGGTDLSYANQKTRLSHSTNTTWDDGQHQNTAGLLAASHKLSDFWNLRSTLNYGIFPERELETTRFQVRYSDLDKFTSSFNVNHNLKKNNTIFSVDADYDFDTYLAGVGLDWDMDEGLKALLRTNMSLGPFGENDSYIASSESLLGQSKFQARVFKDEDGDGRFTERDTALADAKIKINKQSQSPTDEDGFYQTYSPGRIGLTDVSIDDRSLQDEYLLAGADSYTTVIRPQSEIFMDIPLVASGAVDGNIYFDNGKPSPTVGVKLINMDGKIVGETSTDFDGYYSFQRVRPGQYSIQTAQSKHYLSAPIDVTVTNDTPFVFNADLKITAIAGSNTDKPNIKSRLKNLIAKFEERRQATL